MARRMKIQFWGSVLLSGAMPLILLLGTLAGCSFKKKDESTSGTTRVQIPFYLNGKYSLEVVDLFSLNNILNLQGSAALFLMDPDSVSGKIRGRPPVISYFRNSNGVVIAKDDLSLQLLTVYAHFEKLQALDAAVGAKGVLRYPRTIAVNARYKTNQGQIENNALFSGQFDTLLLVPYTQNALPIMANGGVLAHEHFHALFHSLFIAPLGASYPEARKSNPHDSSKMQRAFGLTEENSPDDMVVVGSPLTAEELRAKYHAVVLRGINEGLADVWGWVYSGDTNFVGKSLPVEKFSRTLDQPVSFLYSEKSIMGLVERSDPDLEMIGLPYELGNELARAIRGLAKVSAQNRNLTETQSRVFTGKLILKSLSALSTRFQSLSTAQFLSPSDMMTAVYDQLQEPSLEECHYIFKMLPAADGKTDFQSRCQKLSDQINEKPVTP